MKLSLLALLLGGGYAAFQMWGVLQPKAFSAKVRSFPRATGWGVLLMLAGTAWFLWNLKQEQVADFEKYKSLMMVCFGVAGVATCFYVQDFLAVRGLAVVFLLLANLMLDTGRPALYDTHWAIAFQLWAYVFAVAGIGLTIWPWRLRDYLNWSTATEKRLRTGNVLRAALGVFIAILGLAAF